MDAEHSIKIGCCGFVVSHREYYRRFRLVEVQNTFYQLPRTETAGRWRLTAPAGFEFTMKAWQLITHEPSSPTYRRLREMIKPELASRYGRFQPTDEVQEAWLRTLDFARLLGATAIVFQCPASFRPDQANIANLRRFFRSAERDGFILVWEPRGGWPERLVGSLCAELDLIHAVDPFKDRPLYGAQHYFRLHGRAGYSYDYRYDDEELGQVLRWAKEKPSYVLLNNNHMLEDAQRFMRLVEQE